jgi:GNAT superfamily N-acetyltransferase
MMTDLNNLTRLRKSQIERASETLGRAFQKDPLFAYFMPDASERAEKAPYIFQLLVRGAVSNGEVYTNSPELEGVAVWLPFLNDDMPSRRRDDPAGLAVIPKIGMEVLGRVQDYGQHSSSVRTRHATFPHWFLAGFGVEPPLQGKGYGAALLRAMLARLDEEQVPCYLDTQNEKNVPMYQHFGFKVLEQGIIPNSPVRHWAMLRENSG